MSDFVKVDREDLKRLIQCALRHGDAHELSAAQRAHYEAVYRQPTLAEDWAPYVGWLARLFTRRR